MSKPNTFKSLFHGGEVERNKLTEEKKQVSTESYMSKLKKAMKVEVHKHITMTVTEEVN